MGSFDVACGLSGLTIHPGDPIAVMFLRKKPHREKLEMFKKFTVDREQNFEPSFPIIRGTYDDYGSITNITETPVTRAISTLSGLSIDDFMEALNEKRISMNDILKTKLGNNIIQSDIFNGHEKILNTDYNSMLLGLGFTIDNTQEDETFIYKISDTQTMKLTRYFNNFELSVNNIHNTGWKLINTTDVNYMQWYNFYDWLISEVKAYPGFDSKHFSALNFYQNTYVMFIHGDFLDRALLVENADYLFGWDHPSRFFKDNNTPNWEEYINALDNPYDPNAEKEERHKEFTVREHYQDIIGYKVSRYAAFPHVIEHLRDAEDHYRELKNIEQLMSSNNRVLEPSYNGTQHGNDEYQLEINNIRQEILQDRITKWENEEW